MYQAHVVGHTAGLSESGWKEKSTVNISDYSVSVCCDHATGAPDDNTDFWRSKMNTTMSMRNILITKLRTNTSELQQMEFQVLRSMYENITSLIKDLGVTAKEANLYYNDNKNAYIYILFVLCIFAISFTGLMFNFFRK